MNNAVAFLAGLLAGVFIVFFTVSLCVAARKGDEQ